MNNSANNTAAHKAFDRSDLSSYGFGNLDNWSPCERSYTKTGEYTCDQTTLVSGLIEFTGFRNSDIALDFEPCFGFYVKFEAEVRKGYEPAVTNTRIVTISDEECAKATDSDTARKLAHEFAVWAIESREIEDVVDEAICNYIKNDVEMSDPGLDE